MTRTVLYLPILIAALFVACNSEKPTPPKPEEPKPKTEEEMVAGSANKTWQIKKFVMTGYDLYPDLPSSIKDDRETFHRNNQYLFDEGPTKWDQNNPQQRTGYWGFKENKTKFYIATKNNDTAFYTINILTDTLIRMTTVRDIDPAEITYKPM
jgi:hypothetical protein